MELIFFSAPLKIFLFVSLCIFLSLCLSSTKRCWAKKKLDKFKLRQNESSKYMYTIKSFPSSFPFSYVAPSPTTPYSPLSFKITLKKISLESEISPSTDLRDEKKMYSLLQCLHKHKHTFTRVERVEAERDELGGREEININKKENCWRKLWSSKRIHIQVLSWNQNHKHLWHFIVKHRCRVRRWKEYWKLLNRLNFMPWHCD